MSVDAAQLNELLYTLTDSDIITLPSGKVATIREMTGHEQRNFMNRAKLSNGTAVQELLSACVLTVDDTELPLIPEERTKFILDMLSADRRALIFGIRRHSLGSEFQFSTQCPQCKSKETWEVNLADKAAFPVTPCPNNDAREFEYDSVVRKGLRIKFKLLDGNAEMAIVRKRDNIDLLTDLEMRIPKALVTKDGVDIWVAIRLDKCSDAIITEMRKQVRAQEGNIQTTVKVICNKCENEVEFDLLLVPDFMTPSATS